MNTQREIEIQKLATDILPDLEKLTVSQLDNLKSSMELCYYLKQITTRLEIIANMRFGLSPETPTPTNYSFVVPYIDPCECPNCGADLKAKDNVTVRAQTVDKSFTTNIGSGYFEGYIMDGNMEDATLILAEKEPEFTCTTCTERLDPDAIEE